MNSDTQSSIPGSNTPPPAQPIAGLCKGRAVYYYDGLTKVDSLELEPNAATVAAVLDPVAGIVNLSVLGPDAEHVPVRRIAFSPTPRAGCWSWMPRV